MSLFSKPFTSSVYYDPMKMSQVPFFLSSRFFSHFVKAICRSSHLYVKLRIISFASQTYEFDHYIQIHLKSFSWLLGIILMILWRVIFARRAVFVVSFPFRFEVMDESLHILSYIVAEYQFWLFRSTDKWNKDHSTEQISLVLMSE